MQVNKRTTFSIIMPIYNSEQYISNAIESIIRQKYKDIELLLIDDGSTDTSFEICKEYTKKYKNVKVYHKENGGISNARNYGINKATGKYIMFIDHDDEYVGENLEKISEYQKKYPELDLIKFGNIDFYCKGNKKIQRAIHQFKEKLYIDDEIKFNWINMKNNEVLSLVWDGVFDLDLIKEKNIFFDERFKYGGEDYNFCDKYIKNCKRVLIIKDIFYYHYIRFGQSTSTNNNENKIKSIMYNAKVFRDNMNFDFDKSNLAKVTMYMYINPLIRQIVLNKKGKEKIKKIKEIFERNLFDYISLYDKIIIKAIKNKKYGLISFLSTTRNNIKKLVLKIKL